MININEVLETNKMVEEETLDVRTITMGINLLECADHDLDTCCEKIFIEPKRNVTTPIKIPPISRYLFSIFNSLSIIDLIYRTRGSPCNSNKRQLWKQPHRARA